MPAPIEPAIAGQSREEYEKRRLEQQGMGTLVIIYRTVVVLGYFVAMIVWNSDDKLLLVGFLAMGLCVFLCFWSQYINQFLLDPPMPGDPSILVLLVSLLVAGVAFCAGTRRPVAGAAVMCLDLLIVAGFFGWCVANLLRRSPPTQSTDSSLIEKQDTDEAGDKNPTNQGGVKAETIGSQDSPLLPKLPSLRIG